MALMENAVQAAIAEPRSRFIMVSLLMVPCCHQAAASPRSIFRRLDLPSGYACMAEKEVFFSEEKKQKTFMSLSRFSLAAYARETKVFWFFFSKKNCFLPTDDVSHRREQYSPGSSANRAGLSSGPSGTSGRYRV
jgi:hypothetical protein